MQIKVEVNEALLILLEDAVFNYLDILEWTFDICDTEAMTENVKHHLSIHPNIVAKIRRYLRKNKQKLKLTQEERVFLMSAIAVSLPGDGGYLYSLAQLLPKFNLLHVHNMETAVYNYMYDQFDRVPLDDDHQKMFEVFKTLYSFG